jgi:hypothetical protein
VLFLKADPVRPDILFTVHKILCHRNGGGRTYTRTKYIGQIDEWGLYANIPFSVSVLRIPRSEPGAIYRQKSTGFVTAHFDRCFFLGERDRPRVQPPTAERN